jgi:hypothetical protein
MTGTNDRALLYAKAVELWGVDSDSDPRSARYAAADEYYAGSQAGVAPTARRAENWIAGIHRYEDFWRDTGRSPRENTRDRTSLPSAERRLGEWARYQRRFDARLCRYQEIRLDLSPAFAWDPHEHAWQESFDGCVRHFRAAGHLPYLNRADPVEFALARWLARQLRQLQTGILPANRAARLAVLLTMPDQSLR